MQKIIHWTAIVITIALGVTVAGLSIFTIVNPQEEANFMTTYGVLLLAMLVSLLLAFLTRKDRSSIRNPSRK